MKFRKAASFVSALAMMSSAVSGIIPSDITGVISETVNAESGIWKSSKYDYSLTYEKTNDHIVITGGRHLYMDLYYVIIPAEIEGLPVTEIADNAFADNSSGIRDLELPETLKKIGNNNFINNSISELKLPDSLKEIGDFSFRNSQYLSEISISSNLTSIGEGAFTQCKSLSEISVDPLNESYLSENNILFSKDKKELFVFACSDEHDNSEYTADPEIEIIHSYAFSDSGIVKLNLSDNIVSVGNGAFYNCTFLTSVNIPDSLAEIGPDPFEGCISLSEIALSSTNNNFIIDSSILYSGDMSRVITSLRSEDLTEININEKVRDIDSGAFQSYTGLISVTIPEGVTRIKKNSFAGCKNLTSVSLPDTLEMIGVSAFEGCRSLKSVTLPDSMESLGNYAFKDCRNLKDIYFKSSFNSIGYNAIPDLTTIRYTDSDEITIAGDSVISSDGKTLIIYKGNDSTYRVPDGVETIGKNAFKNSRLNEIILPDSLKTIEEYAFYSSFIRTVYIPESVDTIGSHAFDRCQFLSFAYLPKSVYKLGTNIFENCFRLGYVDLPQNIREIPENTFKGCDRLTSLTLPESITRVCKDCFHEELTEIYIPSSVTDIPDDVFENCCNVKLISARKNSAAEKFASENRIEFKEYRSDEYHTDLNNDGSVNIADLIVLKNYLLNDDPDNKYKCDADGNGTVNAADIALMSGILLGTKSIYRPGINDIKVFINYITCDPVINVSNINETVNDRSELEEVFGKIIYDVTGAETEELTEKYAEYLKDNVLYVFSDRTGLNRSISNYLKISRCQSDNDSITGELAYLPGLSTSTGNYMYVIAVPRSEFSDQTLNITVDRREGDFVAPAKPVIYLYPEKETKINVKVTTDDQTSLTYTYPEYPEETGWTVTAEPDSTMYDENGREYSYLFWEAKTFRPWDMSEGFVVKGGDTVEFFQEKLEYLGLTPKEYNDFIVYWMPKMQDNKYNLIKFQTDDYEEMAKLEITPEPDCIQRIFMTYTPLDEYQEVKEQVLVPFERHGYSVIEWGGAEIR